MFPCQFTVLTVNKGRMWRRQPMVQWYYLVVPVGSVTTRIFSVREQEEAEQAQRLF